MRRTCVAAVVVIVCALSGPAAVAKVVRITLAELAQDAQFIGIVRVERISAGIPLLKRPRATARILESWKGQAEGTVTFVAAPTWACDISEAKRGEEAVVFIRDGSLEHAGRGRMPIFVRHGIRLAAVWPDVLLPEGLLIEAGHEPEYGFIRGVSVGALHDAVGAPAKKAEQR